MTKVRANYGCRQVGAGHDQNFVVTWICLSLRFQITTKTFCLTWKSLLNVSIVPMWVFLLTEHEIFNFTSLNGVVTSISIDSEKILDTAILSEGCKGCTRMQTIKGSSIKDVCTNVKIFGTPPPPSLLLSVQKYDWHYLKHCKKNLIILSENNVKNIRMKKIF